MIEPAQIRAARGLLALSQAELAKMASLSVASVKRLEAAAGLRGTAETVWKNSESPGSCWRRIHSAGGGEGPRRPA